MAAKRTSADNIRPCEVTKLNKGKTARILCKSPKAASLILKQLSQPVPKALALAAKGPGGTGYKRSKRSAGK